MITVVDYKMGNLGSIFNMLKKIGIPATLASEPEAILQAEKLILPGVGAFDNGMKNLHESGLSDALAEKVLNRKTPILGLCLGMQLFTKGSEEGALEGLGWIGAHAVRFGFDGSHPGLKVPHMGWNNVVVRKEHHLFANPDERVPRFYFAHSYHVVAEDRSDVLAEADYGYMFVAALQRDNIIGVQFHPEKSHRHGIALLRNFAQGAQTPSPRQG